MTQQEVADKAGVGRYIIQQWEAASHEPKTIDAIKVARVMGLDMEDLFHDFQLQRAKREKREETAIA